MTKRKVVQPDLIDVLLADYKKTAVQSLTRLLERARRLHEKGADSHRLRQYVQRWVTWLHGGLQGAVTENRFNQRWDYVNLKLSD